MIDNIVLLELWEIAKEKGISLRDFAYQYGISYKAMTRRLERARKRRESGTQNGLPKVGTEINEDKNQIEIKHTASRITTVDELIVACNIDLEIWEIERARVNKWEGYRKAEVKHIQYADGKATGFVDDDGQITIEPLYQIEIKLIRKEPISLSPVIQPVQVNLGKLSLRKPGQRIKIKRTLHITDTQIGFLRNHNTGELIPFHDREAMALILALVDTIQFDQVAFGGDVLDLAEHTDKFLTSPEMYFTTQPAIVEAAWFIGQIRARVAEVDVIEGNHDKRLYTSLVKHFMSGYGLRPADQLSSPPPMTIPGLLGFESMGVNYIDGYPGGFVPVADDVVIVHGDVARKQPGHTASEMLRDSNTSIGFGHIHRIERATRTIYNRSGDNKIITAYSPGCLCRVDGIVPGSKESTNWQQGFAVIESCKGRRSEINIYQIEHGAALFRGSVITGFADYLDRLKDDTGWKF